MKHAYTAIRTLGAIGAAYLVYSIISGVLEVYSQVNSSSDAVHVFTHFTLRLFLPSGILAFLLILPYKRMSRTLKYTCVMLMFLSGLYLIASINAGYLLASRIVPSTIPTAVWIYSSILISFLLLQVGAIVAITNKVEQDAAANP